MRYALNQAGFPYEAFEQNCRVVADANRRWAEHLSHHFSNSSEDQPSSITQ